jgi:steroid delta-isomerase-like uncharacterized protein
LAKVSTMSTAEEHIALLTRFLEEVWNAGHVEASEKYLAPKYTIHHDPGDPWDQQELDILGYKERVRLSRAPFPDQRFTVQDVLADADRVFITWHWGATHRGDLPGFPATGKPITMSGATVYYFENGRLSGHWQVTDRLGVFTQLRQGIGST